ncbi:MAG: N-acetylmuramoyl-L-alanine amidase [Candidatus Omnitrophica bacterium]|nr:N-acetylmuramoyl-L-alanine amidase [Candidatus Omnitrophota bacterium]
MLALCEQEQVSWNYDIFTKVVILEKETQKIILRPGENIVLVNGVEKDLHYPVELSKGMVLLPMSFKEQVFNPLFKGSYISQAIPRPQHSKIKRIVIDAGHGGRDPGAMGRSGLREKDAVLDIARRLARYLEAEGKEVTLTRSTDLFIPLARRTEIANRLNADLFVSIHANANRSRAFSGFEVYCLANSVDDHSRALAFIENNENIKLESAEFSDSSVDLKATVWDMINTSNRLESQELANRVCSRISADLGTKTNGTKGGPFYVLKWTHMPAVLIEVGYVSNSTEEKMLKNSIYRQQLAENIAAGILDYCGDFNVAKGKK